MYLIVQHLFKNLNQIEDELTYSDVIEMHQYLHTLMTSQWNDLEIVGWLATFIDPQFKKLSAASSTIKQKVFWKLCEKIEFSHQTNNLSTINQASATEISLFLMIKSNSPPYLQLTLSFKCIYLFYKSLNMI
ncbi:13438_t:CDS:1 [Cetraspora pellucida]|uniref:13438_t:CDS:1 n=1 Tax=Cetraspora pellucida TaxID=1433469 RepID=A0ACA9LEF2_9GLOM|nr:13438_t:CDS:1 [Cetraspora pellucida]